jgi:hypothetical protein
MICYYLPVFLFLFENNVWVPRDMNEILYEYILIIVLFHSICLMSYYLRVYMCYLIVCILVLTKYVNYWTDNIVLYAKYTFGIMFSNDQRTVKKIRPISV